MSQREGEGVQTSFEGLPPKAKKSEEREGRPRKGKKMSWEGISIKNARKERNLTQQQLSDLLDIPKRTIEEWERGTRTPPS